MTHPPVNLVLAALLASTVATAWAAPTADGKLLLRFRSSNDTDAFVVHRTERIVERSWTGETSRHLVESKQAFKRKVVQHSDGLLAAKLKMLRSKLVIDGLEGPTPGELPVVVRVHDLRGLPRKGEGPDPGSSRVPFVLPVEAVSVGEVWQTVVPADEAFPAPLTVRYKLLKVAPYHDRRCALVHMEAKSENTFTDRHCRAHVSVTGRVYFDIDAGKVVASRSESTFILTFLAEVPNQPNQTATFSRIVVKPARPADRTSGTEDDD